MKKLISLKEVMIILISLVLITISTTVLATDLVLGNTADNNAATITGNEYDNAQTPGIDNNSVTNTTSGNNTRTYNTNNSSDLPQTGIEDYNVGILLVICVASAIYAYKKVRDYKNI